MPEAPALLESTGTISYRELSRLVSRCVTWLRDVGVAAGDRVALILPTGRNGIVLIWALYRLGATACPINPAIPASTRRGMARDIACRYWVTDITTQDAEAPAGCTALVLNEDAWLSYPDTDEFFTFDRDAPCTVVFTSGSTGRAKGAVLSFRNLHVNAIRSNRNIPYGPGDAWLLSLPLYHVSGLGVLFRSLVSGATMGLQGVGEGIGDCLNCLPITHLSLVATQLHRLLEASTQVARLRNLHAILLGGSAISPALLHRAAMQGLPIHVSYGLTECASQVATTPPGARFADLLSSGKPLHSETLRINRQGEIGVQGQTCFLGYARGAAIARQDSEIGYFLTGDLGYLDESGYLHVTGRKDNRFIAGGENIQPEEIEAVLNRLPGVSASVVTPIPHQAFGTTPVAFVRLESGGAPNAELLQNALAAMLPKFKIPRYFLPWPEGEEQGSSLKIRRAHFIALAREQLSGRD